jgi:membrane protease YdiL (CAAX protease family)
MHEIYEKLAARDASQAVQIPWSPFSALIVVGAIALASLSVGVLIFVVLSAIFHPGAVFGERSVANFTDWDQSFIGVVSALAAQLTVVPLILWTAGFKGGCRREILSLRPFRATIRRKLSVFVTFLTSALLLSFGTYQIFPFDLEVYVPEIVHVVQSHLSGFILIFLMHVVGAPLSEEFVMRGFLLPAFASRMGFGGAAVATSGLWTLLHLGHPPQALFVVFVIGLLLSAVLWWSKSIWACVSCHAAYNLVAFCFLPWSDVR